MDVIQEVKWGAKYIGHPHTVRNYRSELYYSRLFSRGMREKWEQAGGKTALDLARERVKEILARHQPHPLDSAIEQGLREYADRVAQRSLEEFFAGEWEA